jgi:hypothetical protein
MYRYEVQQIDACLYIYKYRYEVAEAYREMLEIKITQVPFNMTHLCVCVCVCVYVCV